MISNHILKIKVNVLRALVGAAQTWLIIGAFVYYSQVLSWDNQ